MATVLLLGASGFIGRHLLHALERAGHRVTCGVRNPADVPGHESIAIDYAHDHDPSVWIPRLHGFDVVINAVGILRETEHASFHALHVAGPSAVYAACVHAGVRKIIQISAFGADADAQSRYHLSKREADEFLLALPIACAIVQPSLVYGTDGASARLFTTLASLPIIPIPGNGSQQVQPVHIDDVVRAVIALIGSSDYDGRRVPAVGPHALRFREFLARLRGAMGLAPGRFLHVPMLLMRVAAAMGEHVRGALLDRESLSMLERGNVASPSMMTEILGAPPRPVESFVATDEREIVRNQARLSWLLPVLRVSLAIVWIVTGVLSLGVYPVAQSYALLARVGLTGITATLALYGAALLDLALGIATLLPRRSVWLWRAQAFLIVAYMAIISMWLPEFWLHPFGPVLKNVVILAVVWVLHEFEKR